MSKSKPAFSSMTWFFVAALLIVVGIYPAWNSLRRFQLSSHASQIEVEDPDGALVAYVELARLYPADARIQYKLAVTLRRVGAVAEFRDVLRRAEKLGWDVRDIQRQHLLFRAQDGEVDTVLPELKKFMDGAANDEVAEEIYESLAMAYMASFRMKEAFGTLSFWIDWRPKRIRPRLWLADMQERMEAVDAAIEEYQKILAIDPHHLEARWKLCRARIAGSDVAEVLKDLEQCVAEGYDTPDVLLTMSQCHRRLGDNRKALDVLHDVSRRKLSTDQRLACLLETARLCIEERDLTSAQRDLQQVLQLDPHSADGHYLLSQCLSRFGNEELAQHHMAEHQKIQKRHSELAEVTRQVLNSPGDAELRVRAGRLLSAQGLATAGAGWYHTALQIDPDFKSAHEALAQYYAEIGDKVAASRHAMRARQAPTSTANSAAAPASATSAP